MVREQDFLNSHPLDKYIDEQTTNESEIINSTKQYSQEDQQKIDKLSEQIKPMDNDTLLNYGTCLLYTSPSPRDS